MYALWLYHVKVQKGEIKSAIDGREHFYEISIYFVLININELTLKRGICFRNEICPANGTQRERKRHTGRQRWGERERGREREKEKNDI